MSFFKVGDKFGVNQANLLKKLGYEDSTPAGNGEVRLFKEGSEYIVKVWTGSAWEAVGAKKAEVTPGSQEFTSSGTFTVPDGVEFVQVTLVAGGGGGGAGASLRSGGGGGAGAWIHKELIKVKSGESIPIIIGNAGTGSGNWGHKGSDGGGSSFGQYLIVNGGLGGDAALNSNNFGGAGGLGGGSIFSGVYGCGGGSGRYGGPAGFNGEDNRHTGYKGGIGGPLVGQEMGGGGGGAGYNGNGGDGGVGSGAGSSVADGVYGSGGGGAGSGNFNGGNGASGYCKIEWS